MSDIDPLFYSVVFSSNLYYCLILCIKNMKVLNLDIKDFDNFKIMFED